MTYKTADKKHSRTVRKTLTIDGDLAIEIKNFTIEKKADEKTVINDLLRLGLISEQNRGGTKAARFGLPSFDKGIGEISYAELNKMLDEI